MIHYSGKVSGEYTHWTEDEPTPNNVINIRKIYETIDAPVDTHIVTSAWSFVARTPSVAILHLSGYLRANNNSIEWAGTIDIYHRESTGNEVVAVVETTSGDPGIFGTITISGTGLNSVLTLPFNILSSGVLAVSQN